MNITEVRLENPVPDAPAVPARYAKAIGSDVGNEHVVALITRYWRGFEAFAEAGLGPVLLGTAREYKTVAAAALARAIWHDWQVGVEWAPCATMLTVLERDRYTDATRACLKWWRTVPVLVMDDFAVARPESYGADIIREVCSARFDALLPTIWTGNLALNPGQEFAKIAQLYGPLFARRLQDAGSGLTVLLE